MLDVSFEFANMGEVLCGNGAALECDLNNINIAKVLQILVGEVKDVRLCCMYNETYD